MIQRLRGPLPGEAPATGGRPRSAGTGGFACLRAGRIRLPRDGRHSLSPDGSSASPKRLPQGECTLNDHPRHGDAGVVVCPMTR